VRPPSAGALSGLGRFLFIRVQIAQRVGQQLQAPAQTPVDRRHRNPEHAGSLGLRDALNAHQLKRLARRVPLGLGRDGSIAGNGSGDIFVAFSTANPNIFTPKLADVKMLNNEELNPLFQATVESTEEAVINAMVAAETMTGYDGHTVYALPHDKLREVMKKYNRLTK